MNSPPEPACHALQRCLQIMAVMLVCLSGSAALAATTTIPGSPISINLFDVSGGRHQVLYNGVKQVYESGGVSDAGITINLGGTRYGFSGAATSGVVGNQNKGISSQSALLGNGTGVSPWQVVTVFTAGANTTITQTVSYVNGQNFLLFKWDITSTVNQTGVNFFHGADMFTFNNDNSLSGFSSACNSMYSYNTVGGVSLYQEFVGLTPSSAYQGAGYATIWSQMRSGSLNNTNNTTVIDNGIALQWNFNLTANVTQTIQQKWAFGASPCSTTVLASLSGRVYGDTNHNNTLDGAETGTGVSGLYAKLIPNGSSSALTEAPVDAVTGAYLFAAVPPGNFTVIVDNNQTISDVTPYKPPGYIGTENPGQTVTVAIGTGNIVGVNFGLFAGSTLSGTVFRDNAQASGTANDALRNGGEVLLSGITMTVTDGTNTLDSGQTDGAGAFTLWVPTGSLSSLFVMVSPGSAFNVTGHNLNNASPTVATSLSDVNASRRAWTFASGQTVTGYNFGLVPRTIFAPDQSVGGLSPGTVTFTHTYRPGTFGMAALSLSPPGGYTALAYLDADCDGAISSAERSGAITSINVNASWPREPDGQLKACALEVLVQVPNGQPADASVNVGAGLTLTWSATSVTEPRTVTDTIRLNRVGQLSLVKQVRNVAAAGTAGSSASGKPGDLLEYCISFRNLGGPLTNLIVRDPVPFFTDFVPGSIQLTIGTVTSNVPDVTGFDAANRVVVVNVGALAAGLQGQVCYQATIR